MIIKNWPILPDFVGSILISIAMFLNFNEVSAEIIFQESFDDQPDWTSAMHSSDTSQFQVSHVLPEGWHVLRQSPSWAPSVGHPDRHEAVEILSRNSDKARGKKGKSFVSWRDSHDPGWNRYNSESVLQYNIDGEGLSEIYVEYWITFSQEMIKTYYIGDILGSSKIFRIMSHDNPYNYEMESYFNYFGSNNKPIYIWGTSGGTTYGIRNKTSIYRYSPNDSDLNATLNDGPWKFRNGDWSGWYANSATDGQSMAGGNPVLTDYKNGGSITDGPVDIDQVFGDENTYVKMGHYVKMNSEPGVPDGELMQFIDDRRISHITGITWVVEESPMKKWNVVTIGGNDFFQGYDNDERHEEWYSIDDITIRSNLPKDIIKYRR